MNITTEVKSLQAGNTTPISNPITCDFCKKPVPKGADRVWLGGVHFACLDCAHEHLMQCADCGHWHTPEELTTVADGSVVCNRCLERNYERCKSCDEWHRRDDMHELHSGNYICNTCRDYGDYVECEGCGRLVHIDDVERVRYQNRRDEWEYLCPECLQRERDNGEIAVCDCCGEYVHYCWAHNDGYGNTVCAHCYDWYDFNTCEGCGRILPSDDVYYSNDGDHVYCESCYNDNESEYVHSYHNGACCGTQFHSTDAEPTHYGNIRYFGLELEVDGEEDNDAIEETFKALNGSGYIDDDIHAHFEHDGSLDGGFEIITQPMTRRFLDEYRPHVEKVAKILSRAGYRSHDTTRPHAACIYTSAATLSMSEQSTT